MNTFFRPIARLAVSVTVVAASFAHGADVLLTPIDWSVSGAAGVIAGGTTVPISPLGNAQFGYVSTPAEFMAHRRSCSRMKAMVQRTRPTAPRSFWVRSLPPPTKSWTFTSIM